MITEKVFEDILCKYPELIEEDLSFQGRQISVYGKVMDILFKDRFKDKLIVELKVGPIDRKHIGQVMEYEGGVLNVEEPTARIMLVGNRVPPNLKKALDHHGIEWREITLSSLKRFLEEKQNIDLLKYFDDIEEKPVLPSTRPTTARPAQTYQSNDAQPALFTPVEGRHIKKADEQLNSGMDKIYFYTNANVGQAMELDIKHVYFKAKGEKAVSAVADFVDMVNENPRNYRLAEGVNDKGKYYYGFRNLRWLKEPIILSHLKYYNTSQYLRVDVPGPCIIHEPEKTKKHLEPDLTSH